MTDTRTEFDEWKTKRDIETNNSPIMPFEIWQACQSLNDKRIQQLLALVEKKNEGLIKACELIEKFSLQVHNGSDCLRIYNAVELQPSGVELVEVGKVNEVGGSLWASQYSPNNGVKVGDIVYTIKQKGK